MKAEDKLFLLEAVLAVAYSNETKAQFLLNKSKADRIVAIHEKYGKDVVAKELTKLKEVVYADRAD
jgi:hypothetical protein